MNEWPERLLDSAATLRRAAAELEAALRDQRRFALLTDNRAATTEAAAVVGDFTRSLERALAAVVDLTAYDNPDRDYPDLTWYEFRCPNAVVGKHTDTLPS